MNWFEIQHLALHSQGVLYQQYIDSLKHLKNVTYNGPLGWFAHLVEDTFTPPSQFHTYQALCQRIHSKLNPITSAMMRSGFSKNRLEAKSALYQCPLSFAFECFFYRFFSLYYLADDPPAGASRLLSFLGSSPPSVVGYFYHFYPTLDNFSNNIYLLPAYNSRVKPSVWQQWMLQQSRNKKLRSSYIYQSTNPNLRLLKQHRYSRNSQ